MGVPFTPVITRTFDDRCKDLDTDYNSWNNLTIVINSNEVRFFVNGTEVYNITGASLSSVDSVWAGSQKSTRVYDLYIDDVVEYQDSTKTGYEDFDDESDGYFTGK